MKTKYFLILACAALFSISSCVKDTCNGELGNTFETIEFDSINSSLDSITVNFSMQTLENLPESYFTNVIPGDDETVAQMESIVVTKTQLVLTLENSIVPEVDQNIDLTFNFHFMDRRNYIDCQHSGSADAYFLELSFNLSRVEDAVYIFSDFEWNEIFAAGHL